MGVPAKSPSRKYLEEEREEYSGEKARRIFILNVRGGKQGA